MCSSSAGSPLSPQVTPRAPHRSHPHPIFSLGKPSLSKGAKQGRRLSIGLQGIRPLESHSTNSDAAASKEQSNSEKLAEQLRRQSAEGTLPVSLSALKVRGHSFTSDAAFAVLHKLTQLIASCWSSS